MTAPAICSRCGAPAPQRIGYCSTGCSLADRLPRGEGDLPASWQLGVALALSFVLFNQWLLAAMILVAESRGKAGAATGFALGSLACGVLIFLANLLLFWIARPKRWTDGFAWLLALAVATFAAFHSPAELGLPSLFWFAFVNLLMFSWLLRGLRRARA